MPARSDRIRRRMVFCLIVGVGEELPNIFDLSNNEELV